jgi:hypothetical protein
MRDFRDAKSMAQAIRAELAAKGLKITTSQSLELIAKAFGVVDWNTLSALIKAAGKPPERPPSALPLDASDRALDQLAKGMGKRDWNELAAAPPAEPQTPVSPTPSAERSVGFFSLDLQATLHRAVEAAAARRHEYTTLEHLLLALIDDADAAAVMEACQVDRDALRAALTTYVDDALKELASGRSGPDQQAPTAGFHRVIQRAVVHVQAAGRDEVTGANALVAIFSEERSAAAGFLQLQQMTRYDAINFVAYGIRKGGGKAA